MSPAYRASAAAHRHALEMVRTSDRDRFLAALFAPEPARAGLLALLAFDQELARIRGVTREPMLALIRFQWWREAAAEAAEKGMPRAHPVVESLSETARRIGLAPAMLIALVDAREAVVNETLDPALAGAALADLELAVLGVGDAASRTAAHGVAAARLMEQGAARAQRLAEARALASGIDRRALPILLPALAIDREISAWRKPLAYWWAASRGRY
ncbi:MAG TPA: squalene/phytoene synthase family protein [Reyranella sp.]|nr:squalene/phytoene synthase family protein [Reyranella sp.]